MKSVVTRITLAALLLVAVGMGASAKVKQKTVYMFGFSTALTDSVVYITDIQRLDSAYYETKGNFLQERALYGVQLQNFVEAAYRKPGSTCVVFFHTKRRKAEKEYLKVKKRYETDSATTVQLIGGDAFRFVPEIHYE